LDGHTTSIPEWHKSDKREEIRLWAGVTPA